MTEGDELACHEKDDKVSDDTPSISSSPSALSKFRESVANFFRTPPPSAYASEATRHSEHKTNSLSFVLAHIYHGSADMVTCLLGFAVLINSLYVVRLHQ
jgi:metal iron transporter